MVNETRILRRINGEIATSDGQIEVLEPRENWLTYSTELYKLLLGAIKLHKTEVMASLFGYGVRLYYEKQFQMAEDVWIKATEGQGDVFSTWSNLGVVLAEQKNILRPKPPIAKPSNSIRRTPPPTPTWATSCATRT